MWRRSTKNKPKSDAELLAELVQQAEREQRRKERLKRRRDYFGWLRAMPGWAKTLISLALLVLVVLIADGIRRESKEFKATLVAFTGTVQVLPHEKGQWVAAELNMALRDKDLVRTGPQSSATLVFPDGSAVQLEPNTEFEVRLLDFARGGVRDRSFMVRFG
ncbi:MAG: hypothetical protein RRB24_11585, partial [Armatimonadota bacterium]|nr:hypothetical protein [Armatimonadota bacterium]MDT7973459.1 hypothetical protein [Armatimonadota bacterium]